MTFAEEVIEMTKNMDLRYDRSIEESMLLDIVIKARIVAQIERSPPNGPCSGG